MTTAFLTGLQAHPMSPGNLASALTGQRSFVIAAGSPAQAARMVHAGASGQGLLADVAGLAALVGIPVGIGWWLMGMGAPWWGTALGVAFLGLPLGIFGAGLVGSLLASSSS